MQGTVAVLAGAVLVSGCSSDRSGDAKAVEHQIFDPCSISKHALIAAGVDPASASSNFVQRPGWRLCTWVGPGYFLSVTSTGNTLDDVRGRREFYGDFSDVMIGKRKGVTYRTKNPQGFDRGECDVAVESSCGAFLIGLGVPASEKARGDVCENVIRSATDLEGELPR